MLPGTNIQQNNKNFNIIPTELKALPQWVAYGPRKNREGQIVQKMPINPKTGGNAAATIPDTWGTFEQAAAAKYPDIRGIGFVFSAGDPYCGVDLDKCRNEETGELEKWAADIVERFNSYSEISASGTGVHIIIRGKLPGDRKRMGRVEMYEQGRYFIMTGNLLAGSPATIEDRQTELDRLHAETFPAQKPLQPVARKTLSMGDAEIIRRIESSEQAQKFSALWQGDITAYGGDDSAADLALCSILGFWTGGDMGRVDSLFRQSGLMRPKWEREDYRTATMSKALSGGTFFDPERIRPATMRRAPEITTEPDQWPDPEPLQETKLPPVAKIESEMLPEAFRPWLVDITYRMQGLLDFVAIGAIVCASSIVGAGCSIRPKKKDDWEIVPNLWGGVTGRPSVVMKSPSLAEVMKPIVRLEVEARESFEEAQLWTEAGKLDHKAQQDALKQELLQVAKGKSKRNRTRDEIKAEYAALGQEPETTRRRFRVNDATIEKLQELMNENPRGLLYFRDELTGLLASWDREDRQQDRAFFLECWEGKQSFTVDRIGRGTTDTKNACLSILGGIQPSKLTAYLFQSVGSLTNDGMVQRFQLLVYPDEPTEWELIDEAPDIDAKNRVYEIFKALSDMDFIQAGAQDGKDRPYFRFDDAAQELFYRWVTELEHKIRSEETPLLVEHFGKYRSLMPSLALVFHLIDVAGGAGSGPVPLRAAAMAADWVDYLETHARRIYSLVADTGPRAAAALVAKISEGKVADEFTARDVYRNCWQGLDTPDLVTGACDELEAAGWIRKEIIASTGGRPKVKYQVNPKIKS